MISKHSKRNIFEIQEALQVLICHNLIDVDIALQIEMGEFQSQSVHKK